MKDTTYDIGKYLTWILMYLLMAVVFLWTASLTTGFVAKVLPEDIYAPYFALVLFDGGLLAWMYIFLGLAKGTAQRVTAIAMMIMDFIGLAVIAIAEVFIGGQSIAEIPANLGLIAVWVLGIWTLINVLGFVIFHVTDPNNMLKMEMQSQEDKLYKKSFDKLGQKADEISDRAADVMAEKQLENLMKRVLSDEQKVAVTSKVASNQSPSVFQVTGSEPQLLASKEDADVNFINR